MISVLSMAFVAGLVKMVIFLRGRALKRKETLRLAEAKRELELRRKIEVKISFFFKALLLRKITNLTSPVKKAIERTPITIISRILKARFP